MRSAAQPHHRPPANTPQPDFQQWINFGLRALAILVGSILIVGGLVLYRYTDCALVAYGTVVESVCGGTWRSNLQFPPTIIGVILVYYGLYRR